MNTLRIYLAGACKNVPDEGKMWRDQATKMIEQAAEWKNCSVKVINPLSYFTYAENKQKSHKQVKSFYMTKIKNCDVVLCNLSNTNFSPGTAQELQYAVDNQIPIIGFDTENAYSWLVDVDCDVVFEKITEAVDYIRDYFME